MMEKFIAAALLLSAGPALAKVTDCEGPIAASVEKSYPGAKIVFCFRRNYKPTPMVEVRINTTDKHHFDMWVTLDGRIDSAEEKLAVKAVPPAVVSGFEAKYPKMRIALCFRLYRAGKTEYKLRYTDVHGWHNVVFASDGRYIQDASDMSAPIPAAP